MFGQSTGSSGGLFGLFGRKKSTAKRRKRGVSDGTDNVTVIINTDDIKRSAAKRKPTKRKPAAKKAAPSKPTAPKRTVAKKRTAKPTAPKPAAKKKAPAKRAPVCAKSEVLKKRQATRKRKRERERPIVKEAFRSTKVRLGMADGEVADVEMLMDCLYSEHEEAQPEGMADKEPTDAQAKKINRVNERLRDLEMVLGEKYRAAFSSRNDRGYVLRKFVGTSDKLETWGDPYIARRPVGIGGKTLERVFLKKHGLSWEDFAKESATIRELRAKIEKHNGTTTATERKKAEAAAIKERQKEEREAAKKAKAEAAKLNKQADAKAKAAKAQEAKAEKAEKVAKVAKAKAKKEPTKTNKAAAQAAEKKAVVEEKKVEKIEKEVEKLEVKAEKAEAKAEVAESKADDLANDPRLALLEKLAKKYG